MEEDQGMYHCIVTNDDGSIISDNVNITVYGKLSLYKQYVTGFDKTRLPRTRTEMQFMA